MTAVPRRMSRIYDPAQTTLICATCADKVPAISRTTPVFNHWTGHCMGWMCSACSRRLRGWREERSG